MSLLRQLHHHDGSQTCGLCAQTTAPEIDGDEACSDSHTHLLDGEVALGTYQHQGIVALLAAQFVEEVRTGNLIVAMGDVARAFLMGYNEFLKGHHLIEHRLPGFAALFDC